MNLDRFKICTFFALEAKLLEIEAENTIRFLHYVQVFSFQKRFVKEKIQIICLTFSEIEISQFYPLSRERYDSVNKYNVLIRASFTHKITENIYIYIYIYFFFFFFLFLLHIGFSSRVYICCILLMLFGTE